MENSGVSFKKADIFNCLVRSHKNLYDPSDALYKNRGKQQRAREEIGHAVFPDWERSGSGVYWKVLLMGSPRGSGTMCCWFYLALLLPLVVAEKSCHKIKLPVPHNILTGSLVGTVNLHNCLHPNDAVAGTSNSKFAIEHDGSTYALYAKKHVKMPNHPVSVGIILRNLNSKKEKIIPVTLVPETNAVKGRYTRELLRRTKRRWSPMPIIHNENYRGKFPCFLERVQSDTQAMYDIIYSISGPGVDSPPVGLFWVDPKTGDLYINGIVDREEYPSYPLIVYATSVDGFSPESPLTLPVVIEDDNDNAPVFTEATFCAEVLEHSKSGTVVGRVNATDRDEPKSRHTLLRYYLINQIPPSPIMFAVNAEYGIITTTSLSNKLDRETMDQYTLLLEVRDMGGDRGCLSSTGTMSITVLDINDFAPVFTQQSYQAEVNENESGVLILRIPVTDNDMYNTSNWRAVYKITQGNEKNFFNITTDPQTNEGLLHVIKGINYEEIQSFLLQVSVTNEVSLVTQSGTKSSGSSTVPVNIIVKNVDEGPECQPSIKEVNFQENKTIGTIVTEYLAIDPETKSSTGIRYEKLLDPLGWVNVADNGRISTAKVLDYDSKDVPKKYNITFLATDTSSMTGTCTLVINLTDLDEYQPNLARSDATICRNGRAYDIIEAVDRDGSATKFPYRFRIDGSIDPRVQSQWRLTQDKDNTMKIEDAANHETGVYTVPVQIVDHLGRVSNENVRVSICHCPDGQNCASQRTNSNTALGGLAILIMVLSALLLALLLCLLLACLCGAAAGKGNLGFVDDAAQQNLIVANTEAPGADVMDPNFKVPISIINSNKSGNTFSGSYDQNGQEMTQIKHQQINTSKTIDHHLNAGDGMGTLGRGGGVGGGGVGHQRFDSSRQTYAEWQTFMNGHLGDKLYLCGQNEEIKHGEDYVVPYNYEGRGSAAGSVGCCSEFRGDEDRMDFLNHLEPKFKRLAEVCSKK
ncbi:PREDICTED: desmocollin-3-like [Nanorana parkeri]|uniref:desmocollin-3-like n=1 Tax=Nanorana parkeri TaxID=125878 RepID=UPI0008540037|nr:PREDICTED: desmocollin-3-like [Nanorana parkeri]